MKNYLSFLYILLLSGCQIEQPKQAYLVDIGKPALHSVQSERLKVLMRELDDLMFERMLNEVQIDRQRRYRTTEIAVVAEKLLTTVKYIPDALQELSLDEKEKEIFLNLSKKLTQQMTFLKQEAEKNYVDAIPKRANQIIEICNACHHIFRQLIVSHSIAH